MRDARGLLRLHLGCGETTPAAWLNVDYSLGARLMRLAPLRPLLARALRTQWSDATFVHDLRRPFPWPDASASVIYSAHTLEHLTRDQGRAFLRECARVLAPDGVVRIVVPDLAAILHAYEKGRLRASDLLDRLGTGAQEPGDGPLRHWLAPLVRFPHRCMYDAGDLVACMREAGLEARPHPPLVSRISDLADVERVERTRDAAIAEAWKAPR